jgi:hypothetical protein
MGGFACIRLPYWALGGSHGADLSALERQPHFHVLFIDGGYSLARGHSPLFRPTPAATDPALVLPARQRKDGEDPCVGIRDDGRREIADADHGVKDAHGWRISGDLKYPARPRLGGR